MTQNSITVWLNQTDDPTTAEVDRATHLSLCQIDPYLVTFRDTHKCVDYITQTQTDEKKFILLISSTTLSQSLDVLRDLGQEFSQINSIYVFDSNQTNTIEDVKVSSAVYTNLELLCNRLR
jgi:hypothetical protein